MKEKHEPKFHFVNELYPGFEESSETMFKLRFPEIMRFSWILCTCLDFRPLPKVVGAADWCWSFEMNKRITYLSKQQRIIISNNRKIQNLQSSLKMRKASESKKTKHLKWFTIIVETKNWLSARSMVTVFQIRIVCWKNKFLRIAKGGSCKKFYSLFSPVTTTTKASSQRNPFILF